MRLLHATGVVRHGWAALLAGPSGSGKSDLALRLIDRGWRLLADDYVELAREAGRLFAHAPATTRGLLEIRGLGIVRLPHVAAAPVLLVVELGRVPARLPAATLHPEFGVAAIELDALQVSAEIRVEMAFARALRRLSRCR